MDTGAEVIAISEDTYATIGKPKLDPPNKILYGPSQQALKVLGQFTGTFSHKNNTITHQVFVVRKLVNNLLGLPAITSLKLAARVDSLSCAKEGGKRNFPQYSRVWELWANHMRYR